MAFSLLQSKKIFDEVEHCWELGSQGESKCGDVHGGNWRGATLPGMSLCPAQGRTVFAVHLPGSANPLLLHLLHLSVR